MQTKASSSTVNHAPAWAKGTFVWKLCLADTPDSLVEAAQVIRTVSNQLDRSVRQVVMLTNAIGSDHGKLPWDGIWPYWQRLSNRIGGGWEELARFMTAMRDQHKALISFHVNLTDVNAGLALYPETRAFFQRLRRAKAIYTRPTGVFNQPWSGLPHVLERIPAGRDPSDIVALVDYQRYWSSGLAREQIDGLLDRLPYIPPLLYVDVLGPKGWCHHPGYPDGDLGGGMTSQLAGIRSIVDYLQSRGCGVAGESPDRLIEHQPITYSWSHGGLASNDYAKIGSGYGMGAMERRGGKGMQVYGNQGGYHVQCGREAPALIRSTFEDPLHSRLYDGLREFGDASDLVRQFHLTVAPELHRIASGAVRLPGGDGWRLGDEAHGRARIDLLTVRQAGGKAAIIEAEGARLLGTAAVVEDSWAGGGKAVGDVDLALGNGVEFTVKVKRAGRYDCFLRYASAGGGTVSVQVGDRPRRLVDLPDTGAWNHYGDHLLRLSLAAGRNLVRIQRGLVAAAWSDGTRAEWDLDRGFRSWNGDVLYGVGGDRFCPVAWADGKRILVHSQEGGARTWRLPEAWRGIARAQLIPLTPDGRDPARKRLLAIRDLSCSIPLERGQTAVLVPE